MVRDVLFRMVILCPKNCWVMMLGDFLFVWWMFILMGGFERFFFCEGNVLSFARKRGHPVIYDGCWICYGLIHWMDVLENIIPIWP
jgi:hypothetical protein